jgi:protein-S-isoprenylcysteine O-methyltransferase Ste14
MSFFQPTSATSTNANTLAAPMFDLKGRWADMNFVPAITGGILALGLTRIGGDAIVQDLHAGAVGVLTVLTSLVVYFVLNTLWKRNDSAPYATNGIFSVSRNPAALAFALPLASLAMFDGLTAAACAVVYVLAMNLLVIQKQETELQSAYGDDYTAYRVATPRWVA